MIRRIVLSFVIIVTIASAGSEIALLNLAKLPNQSALVVTGYVIGTSTIRNDNAVLEKRSTVRIITVLRGTAPKGTLHIRTRTGLVFFDRHLLPGDSGVFFLKPAPGGMFEAASPGSFALFQQGTVAPPTAG